MTMRPSSPRAIRRPSTVPPALRRLLWLAIALSFAFAFLRGAAFYRPGTVDEGFNGTAAQNMCESIRFWTRPSGSPSDNSYWTDGDGPDAGFPPLHFALLALVSCPFGGSPA